MAPTSTRFSSGLQPGCRSGLAACTAEGHPGAFTQSPSLFGPASVTSPVVRCSHAGPFVPTLTLANSSAFAATVMRITYGIELNEANDKYFIMAKRLAEIAEDIAVPGRYPVEAFPLLRFLPAWFPGAYFKRYAKRARRDILSIRDQLFDSSNTAMVSLQRLQSACVSRSHPDRNRE